MRANHPGLSMFIAALVATHALAHAQMAPGGAEAPSGPAAEGEAGVVGTDASEVGGESVFDRLSISGAIDFTNKYYFRGIIQEDEGFIVQPSLELGYLLHEAEGWSLSVFGGVWNSFHDRRTGASDPDDTLASWYEIDAYAGVAVQAGRLGTSLTYTYYESPNDAFRHISEIALGLSWDDSGWIDGITIGPYATMAVEIDGGQADGGDDRGVFLAVGIEPSHTYEDTPIGALTVSLPVEGGFSVSDYYEFDGDDEFFGYLSVGLAASLALPVPEGLGAWSLNAGVAHLLLGDHTRRFNGDDRSEWIVYAGLGFEF